MSAALLGAEGLSGGYGSLRILHDVAMEVGPAEIVALVGPNGAGKSTPVVGALRSASRHDGTDHVRRPGY